jgi:LuxR family maltose regulon positive regulatory protein
MATRDAVPASSPAPPAAGIGRPRLEGRLDALAERAVVLVAAPPGSGKTVALASWARGRRAAWLSIRPDHLDAARLSRDLATALRPLDGDGSRRATLVLDDVHTLRGPAMALVATLAAAGDGRLGLVVGSRSDLDLPLGRMRRKGRLGELRADELAFTPAEAQALLEAAGIALRPELVARLVARTEGWATGLGLATEALRAAPDPDLAVASLTGDDPALAAYLSREILDRQPADVREFLLRTSVVERLCGSLADGLTGGTDGALRLAALHRAGLFLSPVDRHARWFRYHRLFAGVLYARLEIEHPGMAPLLHRRAARWLASHGLGREALPHALAASGRPAAVTDRGRPHAVVEPASGVEATARPR